MKNPFLQKIFFLAIGIWCVNTVTQAQWSGATVDTVTHNTVQDVVDKQSLVIDATNTLHAVWRQERTGGGARIFYSSRPPFGVWSAPSEVSDSSFASFNPAIALRQGMTTFGTKVVVYSASLPSSQEIIIAYDSAGGWTRDALTNNATDDLSPTIAIDQSGRIHLAWIGQDTAANWKIMYATDIGGPFQTQLLSGSDLGPFGSGAAPSIAVTSSGIVHIFYRGGDFGTYHIHHAWNTNPGGTMWNYEIVYTDNANDFTAFAVIKPDTIIHLLASGNDGFGFPPRAFYTKKTPSGGWMAPERANPSASGWGGSLVIDQYGHTHITWDEASGNFIIGNLHYSTNKSGTWADTAILANGETYNGVLVLDTDGRGHVLASSDNAVDPSEIVGIHSPVPLTAVPVFSTPDITLFRLEQNYPNPFNPSTVITFRLAKATEVKLTVYNPLGQEIATLVNEKREAGTHTVQFDAAEFPSGVYVYKLVAGNYSETKKSLLVR